MYLFNSYIVIIYNTIYTILYIYIYIYIYSIIYIEINQDYLILIYKLNNNIDRPKKNTFLLSKKVG